MVNVQAVATIVTAVAGVAVALTQVFEQNLRAEREQRDRQHREEQQRQNQQFQRQFEEDLRRYNRERDNSQDKIDKWMEQHKDENEQLRKQLSFMHKMLITLLVLLVILVFCVGIHFWFFNPYITDQPPKQILQLEYKANIELSDLERFYIFMSMLLPKELQLLQQSRSQKIIEAPTMKQTPIPSQKNVD